MRACLWCTKSIGYNECSWNKIYYGIWGGYLLPKLLVGPLTYEVGLLLAFCIMKCLICNFVFLWYMCLCQVFLGQTMWNATYKIYCIIQIKLLDFLTLAMQTMLLSSDVHSYLLLVEEIHILQLPLCFWIAYAVSGMTYSFQGD